MANTVTRQLLLGTEVNARDYIVNYTAIGDGSGEILNSTANGIINVTSGDMKATGHNNKGSNSILSIKGTCTGCSAQLFFDATTPLFAIQLPADKDIDNTYDCIGGIVNNAFGTTGYTGNLTITTNGLGSKDSIQLAIKMRIK